MASSKNRFIYLSGLVAALVVAAAAGYFYLRNPPSRLPEPGSEPYEQATRAFYRGLASLDVGLLADAKREFMDVTMRVPEEPAAWANLALAHLRQGELDEASAPIERARMLAPENADVELLAGRMEIARGGLDEGLVHVRRAVELAPTALRPRFALAEELENSAPPDADAQALAEAAASMDELAKLAPQNMAVLVERARLAAKAQDRQRLVETLGRLRPFAMGWPAEAAKLFEQLQQAAEAGDVASTQQIATPLRNVLLRVPAYVEDLAAIRTPAELISEPIQGFLALTPPSSMPAEPDFDVTFQSEPLLERGSLRVEQLLTIRNAEGSEPAVFLVERGRVTSLTGQRVQTTGPVRSPTDVSGNPRLAVAADWNNDFRHDIVTAALGGVRLLIQQDDGSFVEQTPQDPLAAACFCVAVWAADVEMDGDIDVIASSDSTGQPPFVLRNNGDGSWTGERLFPGLANVIDMVWADLDGDGDPDAAFLEGDGLRVFANRQAGDFAVLDDPPVTAPVAVTVADLDADGMFDLVVLDRSGAIRALTRRGGTWSVRDLTRWETTGPSIPRLIAGDFDNNGALDLVATAQTMSQLWLADSSRQLQPVDRPIAGEVFAAGDLNADGRIDLVAVVRDRIVLPAAGPDQPAVPTPQTSLEQPIVRLVNRGSAPYHWKEIRPRAQETAGDQRINSFGVGGYIEARAGLLFQKQLLTGGPVHIGLGTQTGIDVVRIVWPNGVPQAEFGVGVDDGMVAEQRLKGSCPWVFAWDGTEMSFVTDFLWRSPLGLRINAQDTAGVTQTEDWVRLRGDQLRPRNGHYDVRITAELWETHFFDHVSLMAVDHPDGTEVFVDERFSAASPPALRIHAVKDLRPVTSARDHRGADVTAVVASRDGQYLSTFSRGRYQGIAEDHFVEVGLAGRRADVLIATGWIYPTDSSINVAIAQAGIAPRGLSLEARNADGSWRVVHPDLGFPAGKNKTLVVDLRGIGDAQRLRLRTNLEIYWDALQLGTRADAPVRTTRIAASAADLRYRGFSGTVSPRGNAPETPEYDSIVSVSPRWRDLTGYHTRFGDVRELVERVDDRYVIMNAGDELRLQFPEAPAIAQGWERDFVLIGDGWEKDGDYNTGFSQTVLPLPSHDRPDYGAGTTSLALEDDPVYQRHRQDWLRFHTRYVTPQRFLTGLKPARVN